MISNLIKGFFKWVFSCILSKLFPRRADYLPNSYKPKPDETSRWFKERYPDE